MDLRLNVLDTMFLPTYCQKSQDALKLHQNKYADIVI